MNTSLKRQLAALAAPSSSLLVPERRRSSILFSAQDAAKYDRETFYQIGQDGLKELITVNSELFEPYSESILFSEKAKTHERVMGDNEENENLDEVIGKFLLALHPYVMLKCGLKCLEWLVYRFHVERFNVDNMLQCVLPYYDTKVFVMVVQVLEIEKYQVNQEWEWLIPCKQSGAPLRRATLFDNSNSKFILWMFATLKNLMLVHRNNPENLRVFLGFMAATIIGILSKLKNDIIIKPKKTNYRIIGLNILNRIHDLLNMIRNDEHYRSFDNNEEILAMLHVMLTMLAVCCREIPEMAGAVGPKLKNTFKLIVLNNGAQIAETLLLLNLMIELLSPRRWEFSSAKSFFNIMKEIAENSHVWDLSKLATNLILAHVHKVKILQPSKVFLFVNAIEMSPESKSNILRETYMVYRQFCSKRRAEKFLRRFELQFPVEFEIACCQHSILASDLIKYKSAEKFFALLEHANGRIRAKAVKRVIKDGLFKTKNMKSIKKTKKRKTVPDKNKAAFALAPRFGDDNVDVLLAIWKTKTEILLKFFSPHSLLNGIQSTIQRNVSFKSNKFALIKLCEIAKNIDSEEHLKKIVAIIVPFLFPRNPAQLKLALKLLSTDFAKTNPFLKQYTNVINNDDINFSSICKESFCFMNQLDDRYKPELFLNINTPVNATFGCILMSSEDILLKLLPTVEKMRCQQCTNFPVTDENFAKCLKLAQRKNSLSLELVLTALLKAPTIQFSKLFSVVKLIWRYAEQIETRDSCMKFLHEYFKTCFPSPMEQYTFWLKLLKETALLVDSKDHEFFLIRAIQFTSGFIGHLQTMAPFSSQGKETAEKNPQGRGNKSAAQENKLQSEKPIAWELVEFLLTVGLTHDSCRVRKCSMNCLMVVKQVSGKTNGLTKFIGELYRYEFEILADPEQLSNVMANILSINAESEVKTEILSSLKQDNSNDDRKLGLLRLCSGIADEVFKEVYPLAKRLLITNPASKYLNCVLSFYNGSFDETLIREVLSSREATKCVLRKIDSSRFDSFNITEKKKMFAILIEKTINCKCPETKITVLRCVRKWMLDSSIVCAELESCLELEKRQASSGAKNAKFTGAEYSKTLDVDWVARSEVVLEFVQGRKHLKHVTKLIQPLFKILKKCIALEEQVPVEYLKQLVLTSLTMCCQENEDVKKVDSKDFASFDVQTVIDCLRCSRNPQTHHHALILLNYAASRYHEQVLHGIMSLFTFMGNSILRQDDAYSTQLIQQTVVNIIPTLADSSRGAVHRLSVSAGIFRVFTSAVQDIPVHRRLPVFNSLAKTLDPKMTLWQLCIILVDNALQRDRKRSNLNADLELANELVWGFGPAIVAQTVKQIYTFLVSLPIFQLVPPEQFDHIKLHQTPMEKSVLEFSRKESFRDVLITVNYVLELVAQICSKFTDVRCEDIEYDALLEKCLLFSKKSSGLSAEKLFRLITQKNLDVIDKINIALDPLKFIESVALILVRDDLSVKRKIMDILNQRILQKVEWFDDLPTLLELVPLLVEIANLEPETDEATTLIQTSFFSLKLLAKHLAVQHSDNFIPVFELASKHSHNSNKLLCASALLCLSELFCLKSFILPNLNDVTNAILKAFKASAKLQFIGEDIGNDLNVEDATKATEGESSSMSAHLLCISAITCMNKMVEHLGSFIGMKFLKKSLIAVLSIKSTFGKGDKAGHRSKVFDQKLKALLKVVSMKIPMRNIMVPIKEAFSSMIEEPSATVTLMHILRDVLSHTSKPDFMLSIDGLMDAIVGDFLSVRERLGTSSMMNQVDLVEDSVIDCVISGVVLKMTESHFRPLYHKLFDWAKGNNSRLVTFYRFSAAAAERLKSLFVTFAGHVTNEAIRVLHQDVNLARAILKFFFHIFSSDKEGFVTMDRFNALVQPLLDLVESDYVLNGCITITEVSSCIIQLAVATNDLNRWQYLVELIALKSSHSNKVVRLHTLLTLEAAANELSKDFLPLLPPAVPFLAELMNDDDPEVELETQKLLLKLENIVGEPLQPYFTT